MLVKTSIGNRWGGLEMSRSDETKQKLGLALREMLEEVPYDQITVSAVVERCGMTRQSFYYHFHNLRELTFWAGQQAILATVVPNRTKGWPTWLTEILEQLYAERDLVIRITDCVGREETEKLFKEELGIFVMRIVEEGSKNMDIAPYDRSLIARFYTAGIIEIVQVWIDDGMQERPDILARRLIRVLGAAPESLRLLSAKGAE